MTVGQSAPDAAVERAHVPASVDIGFGVDASDGRTHRARTVETCLIEINPDLPTLGILRRQSYGPPVIVLREWHPQVLLHEVLHVILGAHMLPDGNDHHALVNAVEVGLAPLLPYLSGGCDD